MQDVLSTFNDHTALDKLFPPSNYEQYDFRWEAKDRSENEGVVVETTTTIGGERKLFSERSPDIFNTTKYRPSEHHADTFDSRFRPVISDYQAAHTTESNTTKNGRV